MEKLIKFITKNSGDEAVSITVKKNQTLFFEGDECKKVGFIISGKISIVSYFSEGSEVVYNVLEKGQMFGSNLIFSSSPYYRGDVIALEDSEILYVTKEDLLKMLSQDPKFLEAYLQTQSDFSKNLNFKIKLLTISSAKERLVYYLTFHKKEITYKSVTKLAKELYITRESLSRTMYKMEKNSELEIANKKIRLK